jgi:two-component system, NtrC family, response regulator AlgB
MNQSVPANGQILIIDDDLSLARSFSDCLELDGHNCKLATNENEARSAFRQENFDICLLDLHLGGTSGIALIPELRRTAPEMKIIVVTGHASIDTALQAMRAGAADYVVKPISLTQLRSRVNDELKSISVDPVAPVVAAKLIENPVISFESENEQMNAALQTVRQVADTDATVLILGESGTGKTLVARALHECSPRSHKPFVTVNCPSLSNELLESELFGHKKGSFTGAIENKMGRVEYAEGGTLFLDEIGDVPLPLQAKLLRLLQEREYERLGDPVTRKADVRIVAATNHDLSQLVKDGKFREDLFYRLKVIEIEMPPLRHRIEDLPALSNALLNRFARAHRRSATEFSADAINAIRNYGWPGNVRELQNVIERAVIMTSGETVQPRELNIEPARHEWDCAPRIGDLVSLPDIERAHILSVIARTASLEEAARILHIDVSTLYRKRKGYEDLGVEIPANAKSRPREAATT